ncbi:hypothetical protein BDN70DRAFT_885392 [Pholiota conissans]|uniref:Uncharacterized protein n=1 Tax=Pholiota conissans TaxID=109636 RepID=A0A9P6CNW0_9AGAR|nr:hypothetical protein BDN70DRAFT_885392 [Pholiota conissans]
MTVSELRAATRKLIADSEGKDLKNVEVTKLPTDSSPHHIAGLVSYLVSKDAEMITGQSLSINGGKYFD